MPEAEAMVVEGICVDLIAHLHFQACGLNMIKMIYIMSGNLINFCVVMCVNQK